MVLPGASPARTRCQRHRIDAREPPGRCPSLTQSDRPRSLSTRIAAVRRADRGSWPSVGGRPEREVLRSRRVGNDGAGPRQAHGTGSARARTMGLSGRERILHGRARRRPGEAQWAHWLGWIRLRDRAAEEAEHEIVRRGRAWAGYTVGLLAG